MGVVVHNDIVQLAGFLPSMHEALSSVAWLKLGMVMSTHNASTRKVNRDWMLKVILSYRQFQLVKLRPCLRVGVCVEGGEGGAVLGERKKRTRRERTDLYKL